ncbi:MAG: Ig-like domain-containing protein [Deltaproteobacteria bacterium]|nr:Ig-like domain-containing protein [Deltaproteobacteria bacterium]
MKTIKYKWLLTIALLVGLGGCLSVEREKMPSEEAITRAVTGFVPSNGNLQGLAEDGSEEICAADAVHATDTSGVTANTLVDENCFFSLYLEVDKTYALSFSRDDEFVATLLFRDSEGHGSYSLTLEEGSELSLGEVVIVGTSAIPSDDFQAQNEAVVENEGDEEGSDQEESQSQGDSEAKEEAAEVGDIGDIGDVPLSSGEPHIVKTIPSNGARNVATSEAIMVQASCAIDPSTVGKAYFSVGDSNGDHVICDLELSASPDEIICKHADLLTEMAYTLNVEGLKCLDTKKGTIRSLTWHFETK